MTLTQVEPNACRYCDVPQRMHGQRYDDVAGRHGWTEPSNAQRLERMQARRAARQPVPTDIAPCRVCDANPDGPLCQNCLDRPYGTVGASIPPGVGCPTCDEPNYVWFGNMWSLRHIGGDETMWKCQCPCHIGQIGLA